jgi:hypothetical protein
MSSAFFCREEKENFWIISSLNRDFKNKYNIDVKNIVKPILYWLMYPEKDKNRISVPTKQPIIDVITSRLLIILSRYGCSECLIGIGQNLILFIEICLKILFGVSNHTILYSNNNS